MLQRSGFSATCARVRHEIRHSCEQALCLGFFDFLQVVRRRRLSGYARVSFWGRNPDAGVCINIAAKEGVGEDLPHHGLCVVDDLLRVAARGEALQEDDDLVTGDVRDILVAESVHSAILCCSVTAYGVWRQARLALFPPVIGDGPECTALASSLVRVLFALTDIVITLLFDFFVGFSIEILSLAIDGVRQDNASVFAQRVFCPFSCHGHPPMVS